MIDEVRISSSARSADWIATEFNNQNSPDTFLGVGAEQESSLGFTTTFIEDGGPVAVVDVDAMLSDVDDATLVSLTVTITNLLDGANELLAADTTGTSITASYDSGTGVLTLTGADTVANYQQVLRTVAYENSSQAPDTTARTISFVANDGTDPSNLGTTIVSMVRSNDPPVLDLDADNSSGAGAADYATVFTEDGGPVVVADAVDAILSDADDTQLSSLTVTITNLLDGPSEVLAADTTGTSISASYDSGTGVLTLTGDDTVADYQQVLRSVTYENTSQHAGYHSPPHHLRGQRRDRRQQRQPEPSPGPGTCRLLDVQRRDGRPGIGPVRQRQSRHIVEHGPGNGLGTGSCRFRPRL